MSTLHSTHKKDRAIAIWLFSGALFTLLIVVVGGITRLTGSGLSITEWQVFSGVIPPVTEAGWEEAFDLYKDTPEYRKINYGMNLSEFQWIFFWEYLHRLLARGLGLLFIIPFAVFAFQRRFSRSDIYPLGGLFLLGALQGYAGWWMVQSGLVDVPYVSHLRLAFHLFLGFAISGWAFYLAMSWWPSKPVTGSPAPKWMKKMTRLFLVLLSLQIIWGAFVAGLKAGYAYPQWPLMGPSLIPAELGNESSFFRDILYNGVTVQFIHRWLAFLLIPIPVALCWKVYTTQALHYLKKPVTIVAGLLVVQIILGILTLLLHVPSSLAVLHQFVALMILWAVIWLFRNMQNES